MRQKKSNLIYYACAIMFSMALTLLVGDNTVWDYSNKSWLNITTKETINSLNWQEYKVYLDNKYFGEYSMWYSDNKWYAFKSDKSAVKMEGELLAYRSNHDLKIREFEKKENKGIVAELFFIP